MAEVAKQFGISKATGIDLPGERAEMGEHFGTMPTRDWKRKIMEEKWYQGDTLNVSIGQGYVQVSPLQMALATAAVANGGRVYRPFVVAEKQKANKMIWKMNPQVVSTVNASKKNFDLVKSAMRQTVTNGTGRVCDIKDVTVCGKTGSAEARGAAHGWFVCFAPQENPKIAIAVIVEHGRHGATTAAPVCRAMLDVYFGKKMAQDVKQNKAAVSGD